jgi:hypothetical protein
VTVKLSLDVAKAKVDSLVSTLSSFDVELQPSCDAKVTMFFEIESKLSFDIDLAEMK